ncbi:MFS general substrate transporter [Pholiota molesta]|nr:MFS general substrate transporter [Pholiota molesta]
MASEKAAMEPNIETTPTPTSMISAEQSKSHSDTMPSAKEDADSYKANESEATPSLTRQQRNIALIQYVTLLWPMIVAGWNDGTTGPLLPRIQEVYHVNFTIVSLIFVFACIGFVGGAVANMYLTPRFGFGKVIVFGSACQVIAYAIQCSAPPFPVFVMAYTINGVGMALQDAQANGFVATLQSNAETKMGILHAAYGLGAFASPLAATQFAQMHRWSFHFLVSVSIAAVNTVLLTLVFKLKTQDECFELAGEPIPEKADEGEEGSFKQVMQTRAVHLLAFFILIYVGVEVTIGGWIVTFIINVRNGGPSSGYISSGFFGGLTLGRVALLWVNRKVGERLVLFIYGILSIALALTIWFVPSLIGNAVAISVIGVLLGPMYPIAMNQTGRILPRWILTSSIGWIAGFGQAGSAVFPFLTGAISEKHGIKTLQPLLIAMMAFMLILWALVPRAPPKALFRAD